MIQEQIYAAAVLAACIDFFSISVSTSKAEPN